MSVEEQLSALMEKYTKLQIKHKQLSESWDYHFHRREELETKIEQLQPEIERLKEDIKEWREYKKGIDELLKGNKKEFKQLLAENEKLRVVTPA